MFRFTRPTQQATAALLRAAEVALPFSLQLLSLAEGLSGTPPAGFAHDFSRLEIGRGLHAFSAARIAFENWEQFDLGWVQVTDPALEIIPGALVTVECFTAGLWSTNINRIMETVDDPTRFGFLYTTTALHVEEGQERFVLEFDEQSGAVSYLIEAVSRPRHILARIGYPFARAMQHRFQRNSHARMKRCVLTI
jgi:uncharacterized protein (UPF0548 family)